jgi:hypothetical protein
MALAAMDLGHVILTRFNIWAPFGGSDTVRLDETYLEYRLRLFESYCLPSVAGQTCRAFRWVVFFDQDTPAAIKERVEGYRRRHEFLLPAYLSQDDGVAFDTRVWPFVPPEAAAGRRYLLTTRLDNDDALANHFVQAVQSAVAEGDEFINLPRGYRYVERTGKLYELRHPSSPFASRLEDRRRGDPATVLHVDHMKLHTVGRVRQVEGPPGWVIVVHGGNVSNSRDPSERRVPRSALWASFALPPDVVDRPERRAAIAAENLGRHLRVGLWAPALRVARGVARRARGLVGRAAPGGPPHQPISHRS